ncbi:hypothetical protein M8818_006219 [Zalaria obscura]|uniref:Uncharacterized protein n=1 Tax=Zalaria obscura TaxID=2024903 RepID=A0ACC3S7Y6_9PEZI
MSTVLQRGSAVSRPARPSRTDLADSVYQPYPSLAVLSGLSEHRHELRRYAAVAQSVAQWMASIPLAAYQRWLERLHDPRLLGLPAVKLVVCNPGRESQPSLRQVGKTYSLYTCKFVYCWSGDYMYGGRLNPALLTLYQRQV